MRTRLLTTLLVLLPLGCGYPTGLQETRDPAGPLDPGAGVVLRTERSEYRLGDTITIVLRNTGREAIGYNFCLSARELRTGGAWRRFEPLRACAAVLHLLDPGAEASFEEPITGEWQPGEHRMVTTVERMRTGDRGEVFTPSFIVRP